jgi:hypothetical protein
VVGLFTLLSAWGCGSDGGDDKKPAAVDDAGGVDAATPVGDGGPVDTLDGGPTLLRTAGPVRRLNITR